MQILIKYSKVSIVALSVLGVLADLAARIALNHFQVVHVAELYSFLSLPESGSRFVYAYECVIIALIAGSQAQRLWSDANVTKEVDLAARGRLFVGLMFLVFSGSLTLTLGNPIAAVGLLSPGSGATRAIVLDVQPWLRRWIEPGYGALLLAVFVILRTSTGILKIAGWKELLTAIMLLITLESVLLHPVGADSRELLGSSLLPAAHYLFVQLVLFCWVEYLGNGDGTLACDRKAKDPCSTRLLVSAATLAAVTIGISSVVQHRLEQSSTIQAGAHYYSWFPENWSHGYVGQTVIPPYTSELGEYRSDSSEVLSHHIARAVEAGLTFFIFDWWSERPIIGRRLRKIIPKVNWGSFKFAVMYETLDLKTKAASPVPYEDQNAIVLTRERAVAMQGHWEHIVKRFANNSSYLRVGNKPVIFVYATRHVLGEVSRRVSMARLHVRAKTGTELFLIADEAFFNVLTNGRTKAIMRREGQPEWDRIITFDAITAYNPYDATRTEHAGAHGARRFIQDVLEIYSRYRGVASTVGERFIPSVLPGYNDRGVRLGEDHYVIPRILDDGSSFLETMLRTVGLPLMDPYFPMIAITSWNEWNEGTNIEPTSLAAPSIEDVSEGGGFYTQGELHGGFGCREVEELSTFLRGPAAIVR